MKFPLLTMMSALATGLSPDYIEAVNALDESETNPFRRVRGIKSPGRRGMRAMLKAREVVIVQGHRYVVDDKGKLQFVRAQHPESGYRAPWNESLTAEGQRLPRALRRACAGMKRSRLRPAEKAARDALVRRDLTVTFDGAALDGVRSVEYGR